MKKIIISIMMLILVGCGFQLRNHQFLDRNINLSIIEYGANQTPLAKDKLQKFFLSKGKKLNQDQSDYTIILHNERYYSKALASNEYGRDREYTYHYEISVEVFDKNDQPIMELSQFAKSRNFSHAESDLLAKSVGEGELKEELVQEVIEQFIRSLNILLANQEKARRSSE